MGAFRSLVAKIAAQQKGIVFADALVKSICVANWDTNGDGELSVREAEAVTSVENLFQGTEITSFDELSLFKNVKSFSRYAFNACAKLTSISIPDGTKDIPYFMLLGCTSLSHIVLPSSIKKIGLQAFQNCSNLELAELPSGITSISNGAFTGCVKISFTELPSGLTSIGSIFVGCTNLALTELPSGVTSIGSNAFKNCSSLALTELPSGVTYIGTNAFYGCTKITSLILPETPPTLEGTNAFPTTTQFKCKTQESLDAYRAASVWSTMAESRFSLL